MYPMSNVYCPSKLDADGRKQFSASIATGDFDCVIVTLSQFFSLTMSADYQIAFLNEEKSKIEKILAENKHNRGLTKSIQKTLKRIDGMLSYNTFKTELIGIHILNILRIETTFVWLKHNPQDIKKIN
jgi:hypothetical protein